jgi:predicted hydrolase (HD superfamily)
VTELSRDLAWALLTEWTRGDSLRKHALAVESAVRGYARLFGEDENAWGVVALLHDFDYERFPLAADHPFRGCEELTRRGYPSWVVRAILSHADYSGVPRESRLEKTLFACDEMAGFITAAALVRPGKSILDLEARSVVKRMKDKAFARAVSRDDLRRGAEELGVPLETHIANVVGFMREQAELLGLAGPNVPNPPNPPTSPNVPNPPNHPNDPNDPNDPNGPNGPNGPNV